MNPKDMIFKHEFYCVGGVTIHGVIGIRDYCNTTYEDARKRYISEARLTQMLQQLTDEQMLTETKHRKNCGRF